MVIYTERFFSRRIDYNKTEITLVSVVFCFRYYRIELDSDIGIP